MRLCGKWDLTEYDVLCAALFGAGHGFCQPVSPAGSCPASPSPDNAALSFEATVFDDQEALEQTALEILGISNANHRNFTSGDLCAELSYLDSLLHDPVMAYFKYGPVLLKGLTARRASCWNEVQRRIRRRTMPISAPQNYDTEYINRLKQSVPISDAIERLTGCNPNPRRRTSYTIACLFHEDHSPSMSCNDATSLYYCHACKAGGDTIDLVRRYLKVGFVEAIRWIERGPICPSQGKEEI